MQSLGTLEKSAADPMPPAAPTSPCPMRSRTESPTFPQPRTPQAWRAISPVGVFAVVGELIARH